MLGPPAKTAFPFIIIRPALQWKARARAGSRTSPAPEGDAAPGRPFLSDHVQLTHQLSEAG